MNLDPQIVPEIFVYNIQDLEILESFLSVAANMEISPKDDPKNQKVGFTARSKNFTTSSYSFTISYQTPKPPIPESAALPVLTSAKIIDLQNAPISAARTILKDCIKEKWEVFLDDKSTAYKLLKIDSVPTSVVIVNSEKLNLMPKNLSTQIRYLAEMQTKKLELQIKKPPEKP